jgi:hypothetical protein
MINHVDEMTERMLDDAGIGPGCECSMWAADRVRSL